MRSSLTLFAILLTVVFAACKQETKVEETATMTETVATFAPATTDGTIVETQTTATTTTATVTPVTTTTVTTVTTTQATAKPVTKPAVQPVTPPPATTTTQAPAEPAPEPAVQKPATPAPSPAPAPATKPATRTPSTKAPKTHTVNRDGALHPANTENPTQRCSACHGKDLKGGKVAPSCYSCHEKAKW